MQKIILQPQYPVSLRYQEWILPSFLYEFEKRFGFNITILGNKYLQENKNKDPSPNGMFSPIEESINFELIQIKEYMSMILDENDILFNLDLSFPGFFLNSLYHKKPKKCFSYCHATSINKYDYFSKVKNNKYLVETSHSKLMNKVFVASKYHADKLKWKNLEIVGLPIPPFEVFKEEKIYDIISVCRPCIQKVNKSLEEKVSKKFGSIIRPISSSWESYYKNLSKSKILLISSKEDTFNFSILEAIINNCIPLAPNRCSYPELLPKEYIYEDFSDLEEKINYYLSNSDKVPKLLNRELCENFFNNIFYHFRRKTPSFRSGRCHENLEF